MASSIFINPVGLCFMSKAMMDMVVIRVYVCQNE